MNSRRQSMLESVQRVREGTDPHKHMPFARHALRIPENEYALLCDLFPALRSTDPEQLTAAWDSFERSSISEPYRVGKIVKGVIKNGVISK